MITYRQAYQFLLVFTHFVESTSLEFVCYVSRVNCLGSTENLEYVGAILYSVLLK